MTSEKKKTGLCIIALIIAIATILSISYFTDSNMMMAEGKSLYTVNIPYVYIDLNKSGENTITTWDGAYIEIVTNFTLSPEANELKGEDAHIEFYMFHVYSEQGSIVNLSYSLAMSRETTWTPDEPLKSIGITGIGNNTYNFADGTIFDGNSILGDNHKCGGGAVYNVFPDEPAQEYAYTSLGAFIGDSGDPDEEKTMEELSALRNAQTIYIEVSRVCSVSYQENSQHEQTTSSVKVILVNDKCLGYVELTRIDEGFICGKYKEGSLPWPIQVPSSTSVTLQMASIHKLTFDTKY
ncbi:MAG: hypothetical protein LBH62_01625 [Nitrososphaerota archaeon]|jgi:hypothetical protein|nr:hypothetical protein [Nitrososphaerota archaeon]